MGDPVHRRPDEQRRRREPDPRGERRQDAAYEHRRGDPRAPAAPRGWAPAGPQALLPDDHRPDHRGGLRRPPPHRGSRQSRRPPTDARFRRCRAVPGAHGERLVLLGEGARADVPPHLRLPRHRLHDLFPPRSLSHWCPVAVGPPPIGAWAGLPPTDAFARAATLAAFTAVVNLVGLPAASIPAGISPHGLPIGVQLIGGMFRESDVLSVSWDLEEAMAWRQLAPG
ncbi:MAG: hypothetical protein EXS06_05510 [Planctomycetaceae bacterium]|nr:hypothetical protein [Planctomycetaceae bacterium]